MKTEQSRLVDFDIIKGISIIAVVLYHYRGGYLPYGYLGVDIFFVISGYFLIKQIKDELYKETFYFWKFIIKKLIRLWPSVLAVSAMSLILGYIFMLPHEYESLSESVVASTFFTNNVLEYIVSKDYWNIMTQYKPLMHLWYVGLLMQTYIIIPLLYALLYKLKKSEKMMCRITITLIALSLILYVSPFFNQSQKFYMFPFRIFEILCGGVLTFSNISYSPAIKQFVKRFSICILLLLLCSRITFFSSYFMVISVVILTMILVSNIDGNHHSGKINMCLAYIGKRSYSIYIWHQFIIAFFFYSVSSKHNLRNLFVILIITMILSLLSYRAIETNMRSLTMIYKQKEIVAILFCIPVAMILCAASLYIFNNGGVVRDIPELEISKSEGERNTQILYNDRVRSWNKDFEDNNKCNVLCVGNSFARDFANILEEYDVEKNLNISYIYFSDIYTNDDLIHYKDRIDDADFVFLSQTAGINSINVIPEEKLYIVSNKNYGLSNGIIYARRFNKDYFNLTQEVQQYILDENRENAKFFGDKYIDLMKPVMVDETNVKVFTDDNKYITQDCRHLTQAGARYYSRILDLGSVFDNKH